MTPRGRCTEYLLKPIDFDRLDRVISDISQYLSRHLWNSKCLVSRAVRNSKQNAPWWLEPGTEVCPACSHAYVIQTEYRCVACDGPLCARCVESTVATEICCGGCDVLASED